MKPGDEGGWEPSICFLFRRRKRKQHPKSTAAAPMSAKGTPRPIPIFCFFDRPSLSAAGAGSAVELDVELELAFVDKVEAEDAELRALEAREFDGKADEERSALRLEPEADDPVSDDCRADVVVGLVVVASPSQLSLVGGAVGHAVEGPKFLIK